MRLIPVVALAAALLAAPAFAQTAKPGVNIAQMTLGYSYFNRPGADLAAHDADLGDCMTATVGLRSVDELIGNGGLIGNMLGGAAHKGVIGASVENCMVLRGWRVVHLSDADGAALNALPLGELVQKLKPWVGAETPQGEIVRVWNNDAAHASTNRFAIRPAHATDQQLSLKIRTSQAAGSATPPPALVTPVVKIDPKWPKKTLTPAQIATTLPEALIIVARVRGVSNHNGIGVQLARIGPDPDKPPSLTDLAPDVINLMVGTLMAKKEGNWIVVAVPAGRWRIATMGILPAVDFCLGGPAFEGKAGEVIYAGTFDMAAEELGPDLDLEPAKAFLAGQPAAGTVKAAAYRNGVVGKCVATFATALEIKGTPFEPGYAWGGARAAAVH